MSEKSEHALTLNKRYTFDNFVIGDNNRMAYSASLAVAEAPCKTSFQPLVIYGGVGLGKTHLLQSIGNFILSNNPQSVVTYITSEEFYCGFIDSIKNNNAQEFTSALKSSDVLLMDDIQFFACKPRSQEEFVRIFDTLYHSEKQIVLTSDTQPNLLNDFSDHLISRLQGGLIADIQPPDLETRIEILKRKFAKEENMNLEPEIICYIAENVSSNIRELEGVVIRLLAFASIVHKDITLDLVKNLLGKTANKNKYEKLRLLNQEVMAMQNERAERIIELLTKLEKAIIV